MEYLDCGRKGLTNLTDERTWSDRPAVRNLLQKVKTAFAKSRFTEVLHEEYSRLLEGKFSERYLVVSFDCDTPEDANAARAVAEWFKDKRIPAVFAVPGKRMEDAKDVYGAIGKAGFEFLNHGYSEHALYDRERMRYTSKTFYHEMEEEEIRQDILAGHACVRSCIEVSPRGFRAPHFGNFQHDEQLGMIYRVLSELGYSYSTTTMPIRGLRKGAIFHVGEGIVEFPLTGTYDHPELILDSWQFLAAPERIYSEDDYIKQFRKMVDFFSKRDLPCILNYYVDPVHVIHFGGFFSCIEYAIDRGLTPSTYSAILSELRQDL